MTKPGSRAEFKFEQDVPDVTIGHASSDTDDERPAGVLWVPDPEQRHWWREVYVRKEDRPAKRQLGFRR